MKKWIFRIIWILCHVAITAIAITMIVKSGPYRDTPMSDPDWFDRSSKGGALLGFGFFILFGGNMLCLGIFAGIYATKFAVRKVKQGIQAVENSYDADSFVDTILKATSKTKTCPYCGAEVEKSVTVCPQCGTTKWKK